VYFAPILKQRMHLKRIVRVSWSSRFLSSSTLVCDLLTRRLKLSLRKAHCWKRISVKILMGIAWMYILACGALSTSSTLVGGHESDRAQRSLEVRETQERKKERSCLLELGYPFHSILSARGYRPAHIHCRRFETAGLPFQLGVDNPY